jgi:ATP-binding cassette subfamily B protein
MKALRRLFGFLRPYRHWAILAPALMLIEVAMDLMQPRMIQRIVDQGIARGDMTVILTTGRAMLGFALAGAICGIASSTFSVLASQGFGADLRDTLFAKVHSLSFGNIDRLETGQLITRLTNDVSQVEQLVGMMLRIMLRAPLLVIGSLTMAALSSPQLTPIFIVQIPFIIIILGWVINRAYPMFGDVQGRLDQLNTVMQENLAGVRVVKAFRRARDEHCAESGRRGSDLVRRPRAFSGQPDSRADHRLYQLPDAYSVVIDVREYAVDSGRPRPSLRRAHQRNPG